MCNRGLESFKLAVMKDCAENQNCFNENGCDHEFYRTVPEDNPKLIEMGIKTACKSVSKCSHKYCDKYKWVIERAKHYAEKTGVTYEQILESWETDRSYWYMNYYQECNQPLLEGDKFMIYEDWIAALRKSFGDDAKKWAFKCPACGNVQTIQDFIDNNIEDPNDKVFYNCIGRYIKGKGCNWTLGGLFKIHKMTVIKDGRPIPVFEMDLVSEKPKTK